MNAVLYTRSSMSKKRCKKQLDLLRQYANKLGIKIVGTYSDLNPSREEMPSALWRILHSLALKNRNESEWVALKMIGYLRCSSKVSPSPRVPIRGDDL